MPNQSLNTDIYDVQKCLNRTNSNHAIEFEILEDTNNMIND